MDHSVSEKIKGFLKDRLPEATFRVWFEPLKLEIREGRIVFLVPNDFTREWLEENYRKFLEEAVHQAGFRGFSFALSQEEIPSQLSLPYDPVRVLGRGLSRRFTFEEFVVGDCNRLAYRVCRHLAENPRGQVLYLTAGSGLGKSHLSQAVGNDLLSRNRDIRVCYLTARDFTGRLIKALKGGQMEDFKERLWRSCHVLVLEEVHQIPPREFTQGELALALDYLYEEERAVVFTSTQRPHELGHLDPALRSRLAAGMVVRINPPEYETRKNIIRRKARKQGRDFPEEVVEYLARHLRGDIRQIESAVVGLIARAGILREEINLSLARELVAEILPPQGPDPASLVIELVCKNFRVSPEELLSRSRKKRISEPRQVAMFLLRKHTDSSLAAIGHRFQRDHATVLHAIRSVEKKMASSDRFRYQIEYLERELAERLDLEKNLPEGPSGPEETAGETSS